MKKLDLAMLSLFPDKKWLSIDGTYNQLKMLDGSKKPSLDIIKAEITKIEFANQKKEKNNNLNQACEKAIISGFTSSTLGSVHTYQSDRDDQSNLLGLNLANKDTLLKCNDGDSWDYKPHTASQIKDVFDAGVTHKETNLLKAHQLKLQVQSATTIEEIEGINW